MSMVIGPTPQDNRGSFQANESKQSSPKNLKTHDVTKVALNKLNDKKSKSSEKESTSIRPSQEDIMETRELYIKKYMEKNPSASLQDAEDFVDSFY